LEHLALMSALGMISADRIREHIKHLSFIRHPVTAPDALERAADDILAVLRQTSYESEEHVFEAYGRNFRNIIATRTGTTSPEKRVLVIAHYDTMPNTPGADDNASGVAVLLELARCMEGVPFEKTVQFVAVNLEESDTQGDRGSWGSHALAVRA